MPFSKLLFLLACVLIAGQVKAGVVSRDLFEPGDGLLTYDDVNNREWLDFNYSSSFGRESLFAELSMEGILSGFHFSARADIEQLALSANANWLDTPSQQIWENSDGSVHLLKLLGWTLEVYSDVIGLVTFTGGLVAVGDNTSSSMQFESSAILLVVHGEEPPDGYNNYLFFSQWGAFDEIEITASFPIDLTDFFWLYRDAAPVPEPAAVCLLVAGMALITARCYGPLRLRATA